jgi:hypothetical protein
MENNVSKAMINVFSVTVIDVQRVKVSNRCAGVAKYVEI